jgi:hypothetical protein
VGVDRGGGGREPRAIAHPTSHGMEEEAIAARPRIPWRALSAARTCTWGRGGRAGEVGRGRARELIDQDCAMRAGYEFCLRCSSHFSDLSAVRFVYRYVVQLKARFQMVSPKLPIAAPHSALKST